MQATTTTAIQTLTPAQILNCTRENKIDALTDSALVTFKLQNFILLPPFLVCPIHEAISASNGDPKKVILACIAAIKAFDLDYVSDTEYTEKAKPKCKDILLWSYLALKDHNSIDAVPSLACDSDKLIALFRKLNESNLSPVNKK